MDGFAMRFRLRLAELELIDRERRMVERRIKEARFPAVKSLGQLRLRGHSLAQQDPRAGARSVFGSERLTGALLDRLTHHVHILEMNGDSCRLNQSKRRSRRASSETPADHPTRA